MTQLRTFCLLLLLGFVLGSLYEPIRILGRGIGRKSRGNGPHQKHQCDKQCKKAFH